MNPTPEFSLLLRIARRTGIGVAGWLYALPFVLAGPLILWLIYFFIEGEHRNPWVFWSLSAHSAVFLIVGLPLFLVFWGKRSLIWYLPNSLLLGFSWERAWGSRCIAPPALCIGRCSSPARPMALAPRLAAGWRIGRTNGLPGK